MALPGTTSPLATPTRNTRNIVSALIGGMLVCLWLLAGAWSWWEHQRTVSNTQQVLEQVGGVVQGQVHALFKQAESMLVVARHWAREHPTQDPATSLEFQSLVDDMRKASGGLLDLRMVTHSGDLRYVPDRGRTPVSDRDYVLAQKSPATRGLYIAAPVKSRVTGKWGIPISLPVDVAGGDVALFFVAIELDRIAAPLEAARSKSNGTIAVIRMDGLTMLRAPLNELLLGQSVAQNPEWVERISKTVRGNFAAEHGLIDAQPRLISFGRLADYPLVVVVTAGTDDVLRDWRLHTGVLCVVAAAVSLAFALLGVILLRAMETEDSVRRELQHLMMTDALTGVGNRRQLNQWLEEEVIRAKRYQRPVTVVFFDIDHFKKINDGHGHGVGDRALARVAVSLGSALRKTDRLGRFGGEEFVLLLPETSATDAVPMVERMRLAIGVLDIAGLPWKITVSAGIAELAEGEDVDALLLRSDRALYRAKQDGRDRVHVDKEPTVKN